jgi:hypothetical protein
MSQLVPYLWNENLKLKKEQHIWIEKTTHVTEIREGNKTDYPLSKVEIRKDGKREVTLYNKNGDIKEVNIGYFENELLEIYETEDGDKEIKQYDENENLISEIWIYPDGSKDEKVFMYENGLLSKIVEKDEFETSTEELKYEDKKLSSIISIDENGEILMERKILYDSEGKIIETQRIQDGEINKRTFYKYDEGNQLILKEEEKINRLRGGKMSPEIYEFQYHNNGVLKQERWIIYKDESKTDIKYESISIFNDLGLEVKDISKEYKKDFEEITTYEYKLKE